jgi:DNA-binding beta-propeller fold protein YncE
MSTRTTRISLAACLAGAVAQWLFGGTAFGAPDDELTQVAVIALPPSSVGGGFGGGGGFHARGLNSFDIGFVDPAIHTYVLADRTNAAVDVVDTKNNTFTKYLQANFVGNCADVVPSGVPASFCTNASGPNGVIISDHKEVWATDAPPFTCTAGPPAACTLTGTSSVKVIDLKTGSFITIDTGGNKRTDELCEDPRHEVVLAANNAPSDNFLTFISTETHKILGKITFDGKDPRGDKILANGIEQCQWNPRDEKFYLAVPDIGGSNGAVLVISTSAPFHVEKVFKIPTTTGCAGPTGLAIGPNHQIQLGCGGTNALIIDDRSGIIIKTELTEGGADEVWYDAGGNHGSWSCKNVLAEAGAATSAPPSAEPCSRFRPPGVG